METTRREALSFGSAALFMLGMPASAQTMTAQDAIAAFTKGADVLSGGVTLILDDVAEDGFKVPIEVAAKGAEAVLIVAPQNPVPPVAMMTFGPLAADPRFATRIRLARTQEVIALARMPDGRIHSASKTVEVVVGGCGA